MVCRLGVRIMTQYDKTQNQLVINYLYLRKAVGWVGALLPIVLIAGNAIFFTTVLPDSMSSYYYTNMRNVFVGTLCALGVFLIAYVGYDDADRWITNVAGAGAIGVAFCATKPTVCLVGELTCAPPAVRSLSLEQQIVGDVHLGFAAVAFLALAAMAMRFAKLPPAAEPRPPGLLYWLRDALGFPLPGQPDTRGPVEKRDDVVYRACGITIVLCVVLGALSNFLPTSVKNDVPVLFILEALAVFAFGVSWFVKGQTMIPALRARMQRRRLQQNSAAAVAG
jgi:hypothetical protein